MLVLGLLAMESRSILIDRLNLLVLQIRCDRLYLLRRRKPLCHRSSFRVLAVKMLLFSFVDFPYVSQMHIICETYRLETLA